MIIIYLGIHSDRFPKEAGFYPGIRDVKPLFR